MLHRWRLISYFASVEHDCLTIDLFPFEMHGNVQLSAYSGTSAFWRGNRVLRIVAEDVFVRISLFISPIE
jgi:hypothetical protein